MKTAMQEMIDELKSRGYISIIPKALQLLEKEKNQMFYWFYAGGGMSAKDEFEVEFEKYYNLEYKKEEVSPQDTPATDTKKEDVDYMYKWIREKSGK